MADLPCRRIILHAKIREYPQRMHVESVIDVHSELFVFLTPNPPPLRREKMLTLLVGWKVL